MAAYNPATTKENYELRICNVWYVSTVTCWSRRQCRNFHNEQGGMAAGSALDLQYPGLARSTSNPQQPNVSNTHKNGSPC
jgi:hypothetical protein